MKKTLVVIASACALGSVTPGAALARTHQQPGRTVSGLDEEYLQTSMRGDLFEIRGGRLAERRSHNAAVRRLAHRLITDHTQSFHDAATIARKLGIEIPKSPTASESWELGTVGHSRGRAFDRSYASLEVSDHEQDISETIGEVQNGTNGSIRHDARQEIPMLRMHLRLAKTTLRAVK
jgi:putative membrane protein